MWPELQKVTKRTIVADMAHLFDPLGLVNPVIVSGKIFIQQLWRMKLDWDEELPQELKEKWITFREGLNALHNLKIERYVMIDSMPERVELHVFTDASERAYGAVAYLRSINKEKIRSKILCAKSRVASIKIVTLPRLELCAAQLGCQLVHRIIKTLSTKIETVYYWSDSQIVLSWIHSDPASLKTFVANRVQKIQERSEPSQWRYIHTKLNPADLVSRGVAAHHLVNSELWFLGPPFLHKKEAELPKSHFKIVRVPDEEKQMKIALNCAVTQADTEHFIHRIDHKNSFWKLQKIVAYVLRGIKVFQKKLRKEEITEFLQVSELDEALHVIVREVQGNSFQSEIENLRKEGVVKNSSKLASLSPFLDKEGLLRVGGRLEAADIPFNTKHPLLLSGDHVIAKLIMNYLHVHHLHAGPQALLAFSRQRFWITQGRNLARSVINNCVQCVRAKPQLLQQLMGNLPSSRVLPGRPFLTTGVDFCGPVYTHFKLLDLGDLFLKLLSINSNVE